MIVEVNDQVEVGVWEDSRGDRWLITNNDGSDLKKVSSVVAIVKNIITGSIAVRIPPGHNLYATKWLDYVADGFYSKVEVVAGDQVFVDVFRDEESDLMILSEEGEAHYNIVDTLITTVIACAIDKSSVRIKVPPECWSRSNGKGEKTLFKGYYRKVLDHKIETITEPEESKKPDWKIWDERMNASRIKEEELRPKDGPFEFI